MPVSVSTGEFLLAGKAQNRLPRGELWLGTGLLERAGLTDTLDNHFRLVEKLGQDILCLPIADNTKDKPDLGYRYFKYDRLRQAVRNANRFTAAVVDGPFQELANQMGLMAFLTGWVRKKKEIITRYEKEQEKVIELIRHCLDQGVHAVVIADDLAADQAPLISPMDIKTLCTPFYSNAVPMVKSAGADALLHSCGNITPLMPLITQWQLDGLAAIQHRANDLLALKKTNEENLVIMAGIESDLLENDNPDVRALHTFEQIVSSLAPSGRLILSSSCGLYNGDFLDRIRKIYTIADCLTQDLLAT